MARFESREALQLSVVPFVFLGLRCGAFINFEKNVMRWCKSWWEKSNVQSLRPNLKSKRFFCKNRPKLHSADVLHTATSPGCGAMCQRHQWDRRKQKLKDDQIPMFWLLWSSAWSRLWTMLKDKLWNTLESLHIGDILTSFKGITSWSIKNCHVKFENSGITDQGSTGYHGRCTDLGRHKIPTSPRFFVVAPLVGKKPHLRDAQNAYGLPLSKLPLWMVMPPLVGNPSNGCTNGYMYIWFFANEKSINSYYTRLMTIPCIEVMGFQNP